MSEEMIKQIKKLLFDYTEVYDDKPIIQGLLLLIKDNYISKNKIRKIIVELDNQNYNNYELSVALSVSLKNLLKE